MIQKHKLPILAAIALAMAGLSFASQAQKADAKTGKHSMSFFVTSVNPGKGADLGGLAGADKHCQTLAAAAGAGNRTWRAYLSTNANNGGKVVHARDRIGKGPWYNAKGVLIAKNVEELHTNGNLTKDTILTEKGNVVQESGPSMHDILTGSDSHGRAFVGTTDTTCSNWTNGSDTGSAQVGHSNRRGFRLGQPGNDPAANSWNHSHPSRGCSIPALRSSGGAGLFYCFAAK